MTTTRRQLRNLRARLLMFKVFQTIDSAVREQAKQKRYVVEPSEGLLSLLALLFPEPYEALADLLPVGSGVPHRTAHQSHCATAATFYRATQGVTLIHLELLKGSVRMTSYCQKHS